MSAASTLTRNEHTPENSVVTTDRFSQGFSSFQEWMDAIELNKEDMSLPSSSNPAADKILVCLSNVLLAS